MSQPIVAIHHTKNSFADAWVEYCREHDVPFQFVNAHDSDIIKQLANFRVFLWHFSHGCSTDLQMARPVLKSAELMGLKVFPSISTSWHFDDKVAQFYALSAIGAPVVPSYVFYSRQQALEWAANTRFPKVFKLRRGSGSRNIHLVRTKEAARRFIFKAFGKGFRPSGTLANEKDKLRKHWNNGSIFPFIQSLPSKIKRRTRLDKFAGFERGYVYFQDFLEGNTFDIRVAIVGARAFSFTRDVRPGDFRASGSGIINYPDIDRRCIDIAYDIAARLGSQSIALDFLFDQNGEPKIGEISYGYDSTLIYNCAGHWRGKEWIVGNIWPGTAIIEDLLERS